MDIYKMAIVENIVTLLVCAAIVLGLFYMGAGAHAGWGFLALLNLNTIKLKGVR